MCRITSHFFAFNTGIKRLLFPCNIGNYHWVAVMVDMEHNAIIVADPGQFLMPQQKTVMAEHFRWWLQLHVRHQVNSAHALV